MQVSGVLSAVILKPNLKEALYKRLYFAGIQKDEIKILS